MLFSFRVCFVMLSLVVGVVFSVLVLSSSPSRSFLLSMATSSSASFSSGCSVISNWQVWLTVVVVFVFWSSVDVGTMSGNVRVSVCNGLFGVEF